MGCVLDGEEQSIRVLLLLPVFSNLGVSMRCHVEEGFLRHFYEVEIT